MGDNNITGGGPIAAAAPGGGGSGGGGGADVAPAPAIALTDFAKKCTKILTTHLVANILNTGRGTVPAEAQTDPTLHDSARS